MILKNYREYLINADYDIKKAIVKLGKLENQFCIVCDGKNKFIGTLTDGDIRRGLLKNYNLNDKIRKFCNKKSATIKTFNLDKKITEILEKKRIKFIPVLNKSNQVLGIHYFSDPLQNNLIENIMVIMAGGLGKRLRPYTKKIPKPLLPINGKPIIERIILTAKKQGIMNFVISINYLGNKIKKYLGDGSKFGIKIDYIEEDKPLGTAGSLYFLDNIKEPVIVTNADIISNINYKEMLNYHLKLRSYITVGAISNFEKNHYGEIIFKNNLITKIEEKREKKTYINAGIYILNPKFKKYFKKKKFYHMTDFIDRSIFLNKRVSLFPIHENWDDYGIKEKYQKKINDI